MRLFLALKAFFSTLFNPAIAKKIAEVLNAKDTKQTDGRPTISTANPVVPQSPLKNPTAAQKETAPKDAGGRSDALTLLSTLQREARFLDLVHESLDMYTDAQIGAAARDVLRDTRKSLDKMLEIKPLLSAKEGVSIDLPEHLSPVRWKLLGGNAGRGVIVHAGWMASKVEIPKWNGSREDSMVLAAAEIDS
ncbi:MAG: DUF2760 domain-containing protein [Pirellula sp.]|jgi:hypothetical protein|nr:DUF2760 domain-containing protein [Pirellula sp.]